MENIRIFCENTGAHVDVAFGSTLADLYQRITVAEAVLENPIEQGSTMCLNVNVPDIDPMDIKGIKVCRQCRGIWREEFYPHDNPQGRRYFWLAGAFDNYEPDCEQTDEWALANGYVAVVPVQIDMTAYDRLPYLERILK